MHELIPAHEGVQIDRLEGILHFLPLLVIVHIFEPGLLPVFEHFEFE